MNNDMLTIDDVLGQLQICKTLLYKLVKSGELPAPIKLGSRKSRWLQSDINSYIESRIAARNAA